jgi:hypothetical protein
LVLISNRQRNKQLASPHFIGPYTVIAQSGSQLTIADTMNSGTPRNVHISRVKIFHPSKSYRPDQSIRRPNYFVVDSISAHRFNSRGTLLLTVKWKTSDGSLDVTEENTSQNPSIKRSQAFIDYCQLHPELLKYSTNKQ